MDAPTPILAVLYRQDAAEAERLAELAAAGADLATNGFTALQTDDGRTAGDLAETNGHVELAEWLRTRV